VFCVGLIILPVFIDAVVLVEVVGVGFGAGKRAWIMATGVLVGGWVVSNSISSLVISAFVISNSCVVVLILSMMVDVDVVSVIVVVVMGMVVVLSRVMTGEPITMLSWAVLWSATFGRVNFIIISDQLFSDTLVIA
jgi:hypothetical protein